jgi:hypothetical protein
MKLKKQIDDMIVGKVYILDRRFQNNGKDKLASIPPILCILHIIGKI